MSDTTTDYPTIIGADASFKGQMQFEKGMRLLGKFDGEVTTKGQLNVAEGATFIGEVHAGTIRVDGNVKGNLIADAKIQLSASGRLEGDIQATRLEVAEGATLIGRCMVGANGNGSASAPTAAKAAPTTTAPASMAKPKTPQPATAGAKK